MKTHITCLLTVLALLVSLSNVQGQGTAFTYQGRFNTNNVPYSGTAEFQFTLWDAASGGNAVATNNPVAVFASVTNGLFTATLDFGSNPFSGPPRFLQIDARTTIDAFTPLTPRQPLTPSPYAITASNLTGRLPVAQLSGAVPLAQLPAAVVTNGAGGVNLTGTFTGNGTGLSGVNASSLNGLVNSNIWQLNGNSVSAGQFLGTTGTNALEFKVNGQRALRIEYATNSPYGSIPNLVGGSPANLVSNGFIGAVIGGGGRSIFPNRVGAHFATVTGGGGNTASGLFSTAMGASTTASGENSTAMGYNTEASGKSSIAMGNGTLAEGDYSTAIGDSTRASGDYSTAMGHLSIASDDYSTALGDGTRASGFRSTAIGSGTTASGESSTAMGFGTWASGFSSTAMGRSAIATHDGSFVWADNQAPDFNSATTNQFSIRASGGVRVEGGSDASLSSHGYLTLGPVTGNNLIFDNNEIMARDNGGTATLFLNNSGGNVETGSSLGVGRAPAANALEVNGNASKSVAGSWLANSDGRIKQDIQPVTSALATLDRVHLVSFRYTDDYRDQHPVVEDRRYLNVVAQQFREVFPDHVKSSGEKLPDGSDILQVDTYPLTIYSAAAIQELNQKVDEKDARIKLLEQRLEKLEQLLSQKGEGAK
jgi:hypothetical protein